MVRLSVGPLVRQVVTFVKKWPLEYHMVTKTFFPFYLCDSSDISNGNDSSGSSDSSDSYDSSDSSNISDSTDSTDSSDQKKK